MHQEKKQMEHEGESFWIWLQLKVIADIGIIGMPNSGKSSLLSCLQAQNQKLLIIHLLQLIQILVLLSYNNKEITLADIPGLN